MKLLSNSIVVASIPSGRTEKEGAQGGLAKPDKVTDIESYIKPVLLYDIGVF